MGPAPFRVVRRLCPDWTWWKRIMGKKRHGPEIIGKLREAEVLMAKGATMAEAAKAIGGED